MRQIDSIIPTEIRAPDFRCRLKPGHDLYWRCVLILCSLIYARYTHLYISCR